MDINDAQMISELFGQISNFRSTCLNMKSQAEKMLETIDSMQNNPNYSVVISSDYQAYITAVKNGVTTGLENVMPEPAL